MSSVEVNLEKARAYYKVKKYPESLEHYELVLEDGGELSTGDKDKYAWDLYFEKIKNNQFTDELEESTKKLIDVAEQKDNSKLNKACPYTLSVMKLMKTYTDNGKYLDVLRWASKLKPELLSNQQFKPNDEVTLNSNKENYYLQATKALLEIENYDQAIKYCQDALVNIPKFNNNNDIWFKLRIAKSYKELGDYDDSIEFLKDILKTKHDWYISMDMAENYFFKEEYDESLKWAAKAILAHDGELENKVKLFSLVGDILEIKGFEDESIMNKYMYYVIRNAKDWPIEEELKDLLSKFDHGKSGFIKSNGKSYYFNTFEFMDDKSFIYEGTEVSFYLEDAYNKSKDEMVKNAVNIYCEMI